MTCLNNRDKAFSPMNMWLSILLFHVFYLLIVFLFHGILFHAYRHSFNCSFYAMGTCMDYIISCILASC